MLKLSVELCGFFLIATAVIQEWNGGSGFETMVVGMIFFVLSGRMKDTGA